MSFWVYTEANYYSVSVHEVYESLCSLHSFSSRWRKSRVRTSKAGEAQWVQSAVVSWQSLWNFHNPAALLHICILGIFASSTSGSEIRLCFCVSWNGSFRGLQQLLLWFRAFAIVAEAPCLRPPSQSPPGASKCCGSVCLHGTRVTSKPLNMSGLWWLAVACMWRHAACISNLCVAEECCCRFDFWRHRAGHLSDLLVS